MKELKDTVQDMLSEDWRDRVRAEYQQLTNRAMGLQRMLDKWERGELAFKPNCPRLMLERQLIYMRGYQDALQRRAQIEGIDLEGPEE